MINISFGEIYEELLGSGPLGHSPSEFPTEIYYDTRRIRDGKNGIFVALKTESQDGHSYIEEAYSKGVRHFIVAENTEVSFPILPEMNLLAVPNPLKALQQLAKRSRKKFKGLMVGITGSNGKTVVKEWMYQLLAGEMSVWRSPRSHNSQFGVALSLLSMDLKALVAFVETGISAKGEMAILQNMIEPHMTIFTHFGDAHSTGFATEDEKAEEKAILLKDVHMAVIAKGVPVQAINPYKTNQRLTKYMGWDTEGKASFILKKTESVGAGTQITMTHKTQDMSFYLPFKDKASIHNAMTCVCVLYALERLSDKTLKRFADLKPIQNRLVFTPGKRGNEIINDSYSNDLSALSIAVEFMQGQMPDKQKVLIFSDFEVRPELSQYSIKELNQILNKLDLYKIIGIGPWLFSQQEHFAQQIHFFEDKASLMASGLLQELSNCAILIKGARKFALEEISEQLELKTHKTCLEINLSALQANVKYYQNLLPKGVKTMAMVKALSYGTAGHQVGRVLQTLGIQYLGLAFASEGESLRNNGVTLPMMVLNTQAEEMQAYADLNLEPVIYSIEQLEQFSHAFSGNMNVHLEVDTGMHRLGFLPKDAQELAQAIPKNFTVKSIFSHLACAEDETKDEFTRMQIQKFTDFAQELSHSLGYKPLFHIANTAGTHRHPQSRQDMVRLGIGMYGIASSTEKLENVVSLKSVITQIKTVPAGDGIGYGQRHSANHSRRIAIIPIGYADGLMRCLNTGEQPWHVAIKGVLATLVGNICMDMCMIDVSQIDTNVGDEVELFGEHISIQSMAKAAGTIPYEIISGISARVKRIYLQE